MGNMRVILSAELHLRVKCALRFFGITAGTRGYTGKRGGRPVVAFSIFGKRLRVVPGPVVVGFRSALMHFIS